MMPWRGALPILFLVGSAAFVAGADAEQIAADEKLLQAAGQGTGGPALVEFFHRRAAGADRGRLAYLVHELGNPALAEKAAVQLVAIGPASLTYLHEVLKNKKKLPAGTMERIKHCLQWLEGPARAALPTAAARLLANRKPPGAVEALLAYYPVSEAEALGGEIRDALADVTWRDGKADPALAAALADKVPLRRAIGAEILCQSDARGHRPSVRRLLQDSEPTVRLRVALALLWECKVNNQLKCQRLANGNTFSGLVR